MEISAAKWHALVTLAEPTPNREQRMLAYYAEVRRRKTIGQWQRMATNGNEWQRMATNGKSALLSSRQTALPLNAIKGVSPNAIKCHFMALNSPLSTLNS